jgi:hypothetical protein
LLRITEAFPWDTSPRYLLQDRDAFYGPAFRDRLLVMGIKEVLPRRGHLAESLCRAPGVDIVQPLLDLHDIFGVTDNIGSLSFEAAGRLMDHDSRVRQRVTRFCLAGAKEKRTHGGGLSDAKVDTLGFMDCIVS